MQDKEEPRLIKLGTACKCMQCENFLIPQSIRAYDNTWIFEGYICGNLNCDRYMKVQTQSLLEICNRLDNLKVV